jgi:SAM-dependent methyltransferase
MPSRADWLAATWRFVASALPPPPYDVIEIGCGSAGGFVPRLVEAGYEPIGIDPEAPEGPRYRSMEFERYTVEEPVGAVVASTSLHHVHDLGPVLDKVAASLAPGGVLVVVEWDWQRFDEATASWCFARLPTSSTPVPHDHGADDDDHSWLLHQRDDWLASGRSWNDYLTGWVTEEGLHTGDAMLEALDRRFERELMNWTPYFFADLDDTSPDDEQHGIDEGRLQATGIHYIGRPRSTA